MTFTARQGSSESVRTKDYEKLLLGKLDQLTLEERRHIGSIRTRYAHVFQDKNETDFKWNNVVEHEI